MITVKKKALVDALALALRAAEPKASMPILSNVLLRAEGGTLHVTCTDLYSAITVRVPCVGDSTPGGVPVKDLLDRVKRLPGDELTLETSAACLPPTSRP
jgi:DNA polymerase III subunit beta